MNINLVKLLAHKRNNAYSFYAVLPTYMVEWHRKINFSLRLDIAGINFSTSVTVDNTFEVLDVNISVDVFTVVATFSIDNMSDPIQSVHTVNFDFTNLEVIPLIKTFSNIGINVDGNSISFNNVPSNIDIIFIENVTAMGNYIILYEVEDVLNLELDTEYKINFISFNESDIVECNIQLTTTTENLYRGGIRPLMKDNVDSIAEQVNVRGFEVLSNKIIQAIFDTAKKECRVKLIRSESNTFRWFIDLPKHYLLDSDYLVIKDSDNQNVDGFTIYNKDEKYFLTSTVKSGNYYLIGMFANIYDVLTETWNRRAENRVDYVNSRSGGISIRLDQEYNHCISMRNYYKGLIARNLSW